MCHIIVELQEPSVWACGPICGEFDAIPYGEIKLAEILQNSSIHLLSDEFKYPRMRLNFTMKKASKVYFYADVIY